MRRAGGFTLLEVVIALVIAGLAAAALLQAAGAGLHATRDATLYDQAIVRAKSHLAAATANRLASGAWQGDDGGGFRWSLRVAPLATATVRPVGIAGPRGAKAIPVVLYSVVASVSWRDGGRTRAVSLRTEQVGG